MSIESINLTIAVSFILSGLGILGTVLIDSSGTLTSIIASNCSKLGFATTLVNLGGFVITISRK